MDTNKTKRTAIQLIAPFSREIVYFSCLNLFVLALLFLQSDAVKQEWLAIGIKQHLKLTDISTLKLSYIQFHQRDWQPKFKVTMQSATANRLKLNSKRCRFSSFEFNTFLQNREFLQGVNAMKVHAHLFSP